MSANVPTRRMNMPYLDEVPPVVLFEPVFFIRMMLQGTVEEADMIVINKRPSETECNTIISSLRQDQSLFDLVRLVQADVNGLQGKSLGIA